MCVCSFLAILFHTVAHSFLPIPSTKPRFYQNHIFDILRSKFDSSLRDFHVQLYVCAAEFDFLKAVRTVGVCVCVCVCVCKGE